MNRSRSRRPAPRPPGRRPGWHVYFLRCRDGSLYAGSTNDLDARVARHAAGKGARYTRSRLPVVLVFAARVRDRSSALRREAALKRLDRASKLRVVESGRLPTRRKKSGTCRAGPV
ncbi:MAG TPA: GIY-YIG nuclease family protein [Anaeromyxobacteraceae bacterium]|nr:GIY-YIG nuclease family protein [Anaeromyxobacteraceae bacterium]